MNLAVAIVLLDAIAVALAVQLGRTFHAGRRLPAENVRAFLLVLVALTVLFISFEPLMVPALVIARLLSTTIHHET